MIQPTYSPVEALNRVKLMMGYDPTKTLTENEKSIKPLLTESESQNKLKKILDACSNRAKGEGTLDAAEIASQFNKAFEWTILGMTAGTDDGLWRAQAEIMKKGNMDDLCNIKDYYDESGDESFYDAIVGDLDNEEIAELLITFNKMKYRSDKETNLRVASTEQKNINNFRKAFPCVFSSFSNVDTAVPLDRNNTPYIKVKGNSGSIYALYYDGGLRIYDKVNRKPTKDTGKNLKCNGREVMVESQKKRSLTEDFDDAGLGGTRTPSPTSTPRPNPTPRPSYRTCSGTYTRGCKTDMSGAIAKVQACLKVGVDGKYGKNTDLKLKSLGFSSFTDADVDKLCNVPAPEISGEITKIDPSNTDF